MECNLISIYNVNTKALKIVSRKYKPRLMCVGPEDSILILHGTSEVLRLDWDRKREELSINSVVKTEPRFKRKMCYIEEHDILYVTSLPPGISGQGEYNLLQESCRLLKSFFFRLSGFFLQPLSNCPLVYLIEINTKKWCSFLCKYKHIPSIAGSVQAIRLSDGSVVWKIGGEVEGRMIKPYGICYDSDGRIYVADGGNKRLLVFDCLTGELLQVLLDNDRTGDIFDVCWTSSQPQLIVRHGEPASVGRFQSSMKNISCYNIVTS